MKRIGGVCGKGTKHGGQLYSRGQAGIQGGIGRDDNVVLPRKNVGIPKCGGGGENLNKVNNKKERW